MEVVSVKIRLFQRHDGLAELLGEPDDGALRHQRVPLDLLDEPRCLLARQLAGCGPIQIERRISVPLEVGSRDSSLGLLLHGLLADQLLVLTGSQKDHLARIEDGAHSHCDGLAGHVFFAKEIAGRILRVISSSTMSRVRVSGPEPGSLKPMWPLRPMPSSTRSSPPAFSISCSYRWQ